LEKTRAENGARRQANDTVPRCGHALSRVLAAVHRDVAAGHEAGGMAGDEGKRSKRESSA
jgi:hypothetical protein